MIMTEEGMFRAGQLHVTNTFLSKMSFYSRKKSQFKNSSIHGQYFYRLNTKNAVLKDVRVRKALAYQ